MGLVLGLDAPFYQGGVASSPEVPGLFPVALAGRAYLVDLKSEQFRRRSIPLVRTQADTQTSPGEHTINPEDLWRRAQEDWSHGAGQSYYDREGDPRRYRTSKGIDPWTRWQLSLLAGTDQKESSANTNLYLAVAGSRLYRTNGNALGYMTDAKVRALDLPGTTGNYASTPDAPSLDIPGNFEASVRVAMDDWTPAASSTLLSKFTATGLQRSFLFRLNTTGTLNFFFSSNGSDSIFVNSTAAVGAADGSVKYLKVTRVQSTGTMTFYTSDDGVAWTQLGTPVVNGAGSAIFNSTAALAVGAYNDGTTEPLAGIVYSAEVRNGIDGTVVASPNFSQAQGTTSFTDAQGNIWTVSGSASAFVPGTVVTAVTGMPAADPTSITSDGFNVWTSHTASGIYRTDTGTGAASSYATGTVTLVRYVKGRLMAANANSIYNVIAGGALPTALLTHANTGFTWVDFAEGRTHIYAAGYAGDKSLIYSTTIKPDGTALDTPSVAGELPDGEIVRAIQGYLGYILIGTDKGVRFAVPDSSGKLTLGSLIPTTSAVRCFEPQDRFCWYGATNYDSASTGLGRLDLSEFTQALTPAYASDLMVTGQGAVLSAVTFQSIRVFTVSGLGVYAEDTPKVASGTIDSGYITFGLPDTKMAVFENVRHEALAGAVAVLMAVDGGAFASIGSSSLAGSGGETVTAGQKVGEKFEVRLTLTRASSPTTSGPTVTRSTLRAYPIPARGEILTVPLVLHSSISVNGQVRLLDTHAEFLSIKALVANQQLVSFQFGEESLSVFVEDYEWQPNNQTRDSTWWDGLLVVRLKSVVD